MAMATATAIT